MPLELTFPGLQSFTADQAAAITRREGDLLLDAGAGSGKTSVLVERFVRAVLEDGVGVAAILAITFTEKAAAELRERIRARLRELGADDAARATEGAYISTIHGFCARVLRAHALRAGLDPAFVVLDQPAAEQLAEAAFADALAALAAEADGGVELVAAYGAAALHEAVAATYAELRSRGLAEPVLPELPAAPDPVVARRALLEAAAAAASELADVPDPGVKVVLALERLGLVEAVVSDRPWPGELARLALPGGNGAALSTPVCAAYAEALAAFRRVCEHAHALGTHRLLDALLRDFGARYAASKRAESGVDFEDLELLARLLLSDAEVGGRYRERFAHVMVDELQDTNRVQLELIELVAGANLFTVGDAQQSIYGFRHAEVELFEERGRRLEAVGARESLRTNFRSDPKVLAVLNGAFERVWGDAFRPLLAGRPEGGSDAAPAVELLIADKGAEWFADGLSAPWRLAEARALARRVRDLCATDGVGPGDVVVLTRATTDLRAYERALESVGVPTYVIGGRGYWSHPQVIDLVAYLRALANPRDEEALLTVLASPLVGVSIDAIVLLWAAARAERGRGWAGWVGWAGSVSVVRGPLEQLDARDRELVQAFAEAFAGERAICARTGVEELIERALEWTGYDLAVLALAGGERRMANIRKLMRLAREHELAHGPDLRGFLALVDRAIRGAGGASRESEAPVESEGLDAVRLMTIHRAKGLEFPIVCVADLGRSPIRFPQLIRVGADGRFGLRLSEPGSGKAEPALDYAALGDEQWRREQDEERRLFYVAMTRAQERLILSGAARLDKIAADRTPIGWIAPAFIPEIGSYVERGAGVDSGVSFRFITPDDDEPPVPVAPTPEPMTDFAGHTRQIRHDDTRPRAPRVLSYSALAQYERCGYRYYVERVLRLPPSEPVAPAAAATAVDERAGRLSAIERGTLIHALLERLDFRRPRLPDADAVIAAARAAIGGAALPGRAEAEAIATLIDEFAASETCARLARADTVRREERFAFPLDDALITGAIDVLAREPGGTVLVVDYKSDALGERTPEQVMHGGYETQRLIYALAALRDGASAVEVVHLFLERPDAPPSATFTPGDASRLEEQLKRRAAGLSSGKFEVAAQPVRTLCDGCPARDGLCSWPPAMTGREEIDTLF